MEFVRKGDLEKMTKMLKKGLDPNFQDHDTGGECIVSVSLRHVLSPSMY